MTTKDPAFRRAFQRGKKFYGERDGAFIVVRTYDGYWVPLPYLPEERPLRDGAAITARIPAAVIYWNPDGKRWRRFEPRRMEKFLNKGGTT